MVTLPSIRAHNASLKETLPANLVAVFVGGTSGIGLSTAREFVRYTTTPHIYIVGRSSTAGAQITKEFATLNPEARTTFIESDVSLLKNVDDVCRQIASKEKAVNLLFMTCGVFTLNGTPQPTSEGIDRKLSLHYYARMRFIANLSPLLTAAGQQSANSLSRVISVLDSRMGLSAVPNLNDLSLQLPNAYSLKSAAHHACAMNTYALEHFASSLPHTAFIHAYPSAVPTNIGRENALLSTAMKVFMPLMRPWMVDIKESGERHLWAATAGRFTPRESEEGVLEDGGVVEVGSDGVRGSGAYAVDWDGKTVKQDGKKNTAVKLREEGVVGKIWGYTEGVFGKVDGEKD